MDHEWYEFLPGHAPTQARLRWHGDADPEKMSRRRRGKLVDTGGLRASWNGTAQPPDYICGGPAVALLSNRVYDRFAVAGLRGLGRLPVRLDLPDGNTASYYFLSVLAEVADVCFRSSSRHDGRLFRLRGPVVKGLDVRVADAFVLPASLGMHNIIVSSRFFEVSEHLNMSNGVFRPLEELEVILPDPDQVLC